MELGKLGDKRVVDGVTFECVREYATHGPAPKYKPPVTAEQWKGGRLGYSVFVYREVKGRQFVAAGRVYCETFERAAQLALRDTQRDYDNAKALVAKFEAAE